MKKIIVEAEVSLNEVVYSPDIWSEIFKYHSDDVTEHLNNLLFSSDALILCRETFEGFAQVWPERDGKKDQQHAQICCFENT